jgi:hypothetical protein
MAPPPPPAYSTTGSRPISHFSALPDVHEEEPCPSRLEYCTTDRAVSLSFAVKNPSPTYVNLLPKLVLKQVCTSAAIEQCCKAIHREYLEI